MSTKVGKSPVAAAILADLKNPFDPKLVKYRQGGGGLLAYIDARDVMKRLDDVVGPENWSDKYISVEGGMICELSIRIDGEWITKSNGANVTKIEPIKGAISGALKRAAVNWGVGRYLYYFDVKKYNWSPHNSKKEWPAIFLPGAPSNWEEVAQETYGEVNGMDEDQDIATALNIASEIHSATTREELQAVLNKISQEDQHVFATIIENKTAELVSGTSN